MCNPLTCRHRLLTELSCTILFSLFGSKRAAHESPVLASIETLTVTQSPCRAAAAAFITQVTTGPSEADKTKKERMKKTRSRAQVEPTKATSKDIFTSERTKLPRGTIDIEGDIEGSGGESNSLCNWHN